MATPIKPVSIRLQTDGKTQVRTDFRETGQAGEAAFSGVAKSADAATAAIERSGKAARQAATSTAQARPATTASAIDASLGIGARPATAGGATYTALAMQWRAEEAAAEALRQKIDPLYKAQAKYNREVEAADRLRKTGAITSDERARYLAIEKRALEEATEAHQRNADAIARGGMPLSDGQIRNSRLNLIRQGADVAVTGAMGMDPALIAIQQGPQILDALATSGLRITPIMAGVAAAVVLVGGAALIMANHVAEADKMYREFDTTLTRIADGQSYSAGLLVNDARAFKSLGASAKDATAEVQAFVTKGVDPSRMIEFGRASQATADVLKTDLADAAASVAKAFTGQYSDIKELDAGLNFLTASEREQIKAMFESGDAARGRSAALDIYRTKMEEAAEKANGPWKEAFRGLKNAWNEFLDALADTGPMKKAFGFLDDSARGWGVILGQYKDDGAKTGEELYGEYAVNLLQLSDARYAQATNTDHSMGRDVTLSMRTNKLQTRVTELEGLMAKASATSADTRLTATGAQEKRWQDLIGDASGKGDQLAKLREERQAIQDGLKSTWEKTPDQIKAANAAVKEYDKRIADILKPKGAGRADSLAREAEALRVNTRASLDLAEAYLQGDAAALKAEASRRALTTATRRGTDITVAMRDQLANAVAQEAAAGAKSVAYLRDQKAAQDSVNAAVADGTLRARDASEAMQLQMQLQPLIAARDVAEGEAKTRLTEVIDALKKAYDGLASSRGLAKLQTANDAADDEIKRLKLEADLIGKTNEQRAVALALFEAEKEIKDAKLDPNDPASAAEAEKRRQAAIDGARQGVRNDRGKYADDTRRSQADEMELAQAELALMGETEAVRSQKLERLRLEQELRRELEESYAAEAPAILAAADAQAAVNEQLDRARALEAERHRTQDQLFSNLEGYLQKGKISTKSFADFFVDQLKVIGAEMLRLSLINPFRNWALGEDNPTAKASGVGGFLKSLLPGVFGKASSVPAATKTSSPWGMEIPAHALGTDNAPGGWSWVGEEGPELRKLRPGDVIRSAPQSARMVGRLFGLGDDMRKAIGSAAPVINQHNHYHMENAITTAELWMQVDRKTAQAERRAVQTATNAAMSGTNSSINIMAQNDHLMRR